LAEQLGQAKQNPFEHSVINAAAAFVFGVVRILFRHSSFKKQIHRRPVDAEYPGNGAF
jgi:hypothetical protein